MEFYQPQVQLVRQRIIDQAPKYILQSVTICDRSNYCEDGYEPLPGGLNTEGCYEVNLCISQNPGLPALVSNTPVHHVIDLGQLPFGLDDGDITVNIIDNTDGASGANQKKGTTTVSTMDADNTERPMGATRSCPVFSF